MEAIGLRSAFIFFLVVSSIGAWSGSGRAEEINKYVGPETCKGCYAQEYESFLKHSRKVGSYESIVLMKKGLTESETQGCYKCHTTGYEEPGGFRSEQETPQLKNASCETCHGPGGKHSETGDKAYIKGKLTTADCERCHSPERIKTFKYNPLIFGGAH
ncbi:MAG TPA: cytochrome c family protein [Dissulfurispiraceae bacterium]|nr:cytochrome c family protein [Dissulfurispiraceae bacterium]